MTKKRTTKHAVSTASNIGGSRSYLWSSEKPVVRAILEGYSPFHKMETSRSRALLSVADHVMNELAEDREDWRALANSKHHRKEKLFLSLGRYIAKMKLTGRIEEVKLDECSRQVSQIQSSDFHSQGWVHQSTSDFLTSHKNMTATEPESNPVKLSFLTE